MTPDDAALVIDSGDGPRRVRLASYLDPAAIEQAEAEANHWIKGLRHARVDGVPLRERFTHRGDSLWWFAELFLHKERAVVSAFRVLLAMDCLIRRERPVRITVTETGWVAGHVVPLIAARAGLRMPPGRRRSGRRIRTRGALYLLEGWLAPWRRGRPRPVAPGAVAVFVHTAFWRLESGTEVYLGEILNELARRLGPDRALLLIGVGPATAYKGRDWGARIREFGGVGRLPFHRIEELVPRAAAGSIWARWRLCRADEAALRESADLRAAATIRGIDLWPVVAPALTGLAYLQFPWSRLAMDLAGAALEQIKPAAVVTYAEAGGWGRALVLESRRRSIPSVGVQHGFIYRHWLNYLHEPDEMQASARRSADAGFPRPDLTLVFDGIAERHLTHHGRFTPASVRIVGNARLDALAARVRSLSEGDRRRIRERLGAAAGERVVLVASKFTEIGHVLDPLIRAVAGRADIRLVIKCHPAETAGSYVRACHGASNAIVVPADADLAELLAAASLVVTVNSTVAIEAMVLDVPALVLSLPNNLSPFVESGAMAGVDLGDEIGPALDGLLYDEGRRRQLAEARRAFLLVHRIEADGRAAARAADAILELCNAERSL